MIEISRPSTTQQSAADLQIKVIGLGGAGLNALDRIQLDGFAGAELIAVNTDAQSLTACVAPKKIQLGRQTTRGLGAGGDPELGYAAAEEALDELRPVLEGAQLTFICVGLGGGTGSGAAPLLANLARQQNALTVVFATLPFSFEGRRRMSQAEEALASLQEQADVVICFENDRMGEAVSPRAGINEAFAAADQTISQSVQAVAALMQRKGLINVGFDELTAALRAQNPRCLFGFGQADGDNRAHTALERALRSALMDRGRLLAEAANVLVHVSGGPTMTLNEVQILMEEFNRHISDTTRLLFSTSVDPQLGGSMTVTLVSAIGAGRTVGAAPPRPRLEPVAADPVAVELSIPPLAPVVETAPALGPEPELAGVAAHLESATPNAKPAPVPHAARSVSKTNGAPKSSREERQEQMQFEPVTRGRFEKSEPTIEGGQDLDVPTFLRQNVKVR
ncbi:MAG: cell division protein FtsZ [Chthoniobacteraceae bacterium]